MGNLFCFKNWFKSEETTYLWHTFNFMTFRLDVWIMFCHNYDIWNWNLLVCQKTDRENDLEIIWTVLIKFAEDILLNLLSNFRKNGLRVKIFLPKRLILPCLISCMKPIKYILEYSNLQPSSIAIKNKFYELPNQFS